jgi:hypothetical protein
MGVPIQMAGLIVMAGIAVVVAHALKPSAKSSVALMASGVATIFLALLVASTSSFYAASTNNYSLGEVLAFVCGLATLGTGVVGIALVYRNSQRTSVG